MIPIDTQISNMLIWWLGSFSRNMVDWQVTATTIYCEAVDEEVTILVYKDFSTKCTGYAKYAAPTPELTSLLRKKSKRLGRPLECEGPACPRVTGYKEKLAAEEKVEGL
jgi:hypothetical protein